MAESSELDKETAEMEKFQDELDNLVVEGNDGLLEINNPDLKTDEKMLPVHFLPEGKKCYDWINEDLEKKETEKDEEKTSEKEQKTKTKMINSVTYTSTRQLGGDSPNGDAHNVLKAAEKGDLETLKAILEKNSCVNATDSDGYTALHRASYSGREEVLLYLLKHGGNVHAKTHDGWQPIHCAARWNKIDICKILLEHKADINAATNGLQTPLHFAALSSESQPLLELLLLHPDIKHNVVNAAGDTPYDLAHRSGPQVKLFELVDDGLKI